MGNVKIGKQLWTDSNFSLSDLDTPNSIIVLDSSMKFNDKLKNWIQAGKTKTPCGLEVNDGYIFNWYAVEEISKTLPKEWRIPSDDDWIELFSCINNGRTMELDGDEALSLMSEYGNVLNFDGEMNSTGFSAETDFYIDENEVFDVLEDDSTSGIWWTFTDTKNSHVVCNYNYGGLFSIEYVNKKFSRFSPGFSIRLVSNDL